MNQNGRMAEGVTMPARKPADTSTWEGRFGANLLRLMTRKHVTAQEMAERLTKPNGESYSAQSVYDWQKGKKLPSVAILPEIAKVLSLSSIKTLIPD